MLPVSLHVHARGSKRLGSNPGKRTTQIHYPAFHSFQRKRERERERRLPQLLGVAPSYLAAASSRCVIVYSVSRCCCCCTAGCLRSNATRVLVWWAGRGHSGISRLAALVSVVSALIYSSSNLCHLLFSLGQTRERCCFTTCTKEEAVAASTPCNVLGSNGIRSGARLWGSA